MLTEHTHMHKRTHTHCLRRLQKLEELCFTSVCPGKPLFEALVPAERLSCWILIHNSMNLHVCTCGPSVCFACRISVEFLPLNYTVYLLCVRKLLPTCQHAAARRKALIAVRYFVFQGFTKTWRHQTGCIKLCEG